MRPAWCGTPRWSRATAIIVYAGPEAGLDRSDIPRGALEVHARGAAVVPGFVDAHTHIVWLGDRGDEYAQRASGATYEEIAAAGGGIRATVRATAAGTVEELVDRGVASARCACSRTAPRPSRSRAATGWSTTPRCASSTLPTQLRRWEDLPDVVATYLPLHALPDGSRDAFIDDVCTRGVAGAAKRAAFVDAFCESGAYTVAECERALHRGRSPSACARRSTRSSARTAAARCSPRRSAR